EGIARSELKTGGDVYVQSAGDQVQHILTAKEFEQLRNKQKAYLRERWRKDGLPGMVSFLHPLGGEMEVMLDHQSMRWGRYLKNGDKVTLKADNSSEKPIRATVRRVEPFRETTRLLLVTNSGIDQLNLQPGQRIHAIV